MSRPLIREITDGWKSMWNERPASKLKTIKKEVGPWSTSSSANKLKTIKKEVGPWSTSSPASKLKTIKKEVGPWSTSSPASKLKTIKKEVGLWSTSGPAMLPLYNFEVVGSFSYLGSIINENQDEEEEVRSRIYAGNRAYFSIIRLIKSKLVSRTTKFTLYKTLIRPIVTYGGGTWTLSNKNINLLDRFERVNLRKILRPVCENGNWRRRKNGELFGLYKECSISSYIRIKRLKWFGHVMRMSEERVAHKLYSYVPDGVRHCGRPKGRWRDAVRWDLQQLRIPVTLSEDRKSWLAAVEQAKGSFMRLLCQ
ncbi:uncharacterized protein [Halyomorpha halys]|uniref:uncharacterized protein n=1 Tax=Halyomorpha halys TaxID=286706 RepID=UPI0034D26580